jgi:hypothetical protein
MAGFSVGVKGQLTEEQATALALAGIALEETSSAGYGEELDPMRTYLHVIANDESEARMKVAEELDVDSADLTVRPHADGA